MNQIKSLIIWKDVYKRQVFKVLNAEVKKSEEESLLNTKSKEDEELSNKIEIVKYIVGVKLAEKEAKAVSYTHLDVYKRQILCYLLINILMTRIMTKKLREE